MNDEFPECSCITCGDQGIPMTVRTHDAEHQLAWCVDASGQSSEVDTGLLAEIEVGAQVIVHAGTAIAFAPASAVGRP